MKSFVTALIVAAGGSTRMGTRKSKLLLDLKGMPVIARTLLAFENTDCIQEIVLVCRKEEREEMLEIAQIFGVHKLSSVVSGGKTRQQSVFQGIKAAGAATHFAIHDGARALITPEDIQRAVSDGICFGASSLGVPVKDTIKIADENGFAETTPRRDRVWQVQTPQTFSFGLIYDAYAQLAEQKDTLAGKGIKITDDAMVVETFTDHQVKLTEGSYRNLKVTTPEDLPLAEKYLHS